MNFVMGAVIGILWGAVVALVNYTIMKRAIAKGTTKAVMTANICRTALDILALAAVFLLRNVLPYRFEAVITGTALTLGLLTTVFAYRLAAPEKKREEGASVSDSAVTEKGKDAPENGTAEPAAAMPGEREDGRVDPADGNGKTDEHL